MATIDELRDQLAAANARAERAETRAEQAEERARRVMESAGQEFGLFLGKSSVARLQHL